MSAEEVTCHCGTETYLKKDGTPYKHNTPIGGLCFGSKDPVDDLADVKETKFLFEICVFPDPELQRDPGWQRANLEMAESSAINAGKTPSGEARLKKKSKVGNKLLLVYEVPVKER